MAPTCAVCQFPAKNSCSACKVSKYCSPECQRKDWPAHKKICKTLAAQSAAGKITRQAGENIGLFEDGTPGKLQSSGLPYPEHLSPYGLMYDSKQATFRPLSLASDFFGAPGTPYTPNEPRKVCEDLINAYKFARMESMKECNMPDEWTVKQAMKQFKLFLEKGRKRLPFTPAWWTDDNEEELLYLAEEDPILRVDIPFDEANLDLIPTSEGPEKARANALTRLGMIAEKAYWDEALVRKAPSQTGPQHEALMLSR